MSLTGNDLKNIGFTEGKAIGLALHVIESEFSTLDNKEKLSLLKRLLHNPSIFLNDAVLSPVALELMKPADDTIPLNVTGKPYRIYGAEAIEQGALSQMETAMNPSRSQAP
jgi:tRNA-splicing ligase RtcB